jgi:hypothetical protein
VATALSAVGCVHARPADETNSGPPLAGPAALAAADSLGRLDPGREVEAALRHGDRRLLGVQGYALYAPGVPPEEERDFRRRYGVRVIAGTGDNQVGEEGERFNRAAHEWATRYNQALLKRLRR